MAFRFRTETPSSLFNIGPLRGLMFVLALPLVAPGCSLLEDRSERYVDAPEGKPLELPETADKSRFNQVMPVREALAADAGKMYQGELPEPPDMTAEILEENYVVEEFDGEIWLLVNDVPGRLWPAVTAFMNEQGLGVAYENPQLGLLQSELVNYSMRARELVGLNNDSSADEEKIAVQARVAPGVRRKTTEIQFRPFEATSGDADQLVAWDDSDIRTPEQLDTSRKLLEELGSFLKAREDSKSYSQAALGMSSDPLVRLESRNEVAEKIVMKLDYGRAWGELNRALKEAEIPVTDLNRAEGYFFVDFRTKDEREPGWFSWFSEPAKPIHTFTLNVREQGDTVVVEASRAQGYSGDDRSSALLTRLFEDLY